MAIVSCPECGKKLKIADTSVGKKVKGPCGHVFVADGDSTTAAKPAATKPAATKPAAVTPEKVYVACTECESKLKVATTSLGKKMKCPKCSAVFVANLPEEVPAPKAPEPEEEEVPTPKGKGKPTKPAVTDDDMDDLLNFAAADAETKNDSDDDDDLFRNEPVKSRAKRRMDEDEDEPKPKAKPAADEDEDELPTPKKKPSRADDKADAKPVFPSRLIPNILVALLLLIFIGLVAAIFFDVNLAKELGLPESQGVKPKGKIDIKPAPVNAEAAQKADLAKLEGAWLVQSAEQGSVPIENLKGDRYTFTNGKVTGHDLNNADFTIDASKTPKTIDLNKGGGDWLLGIYEFDGELLKLCTNPSGEVKGGKLGPDNFSRRPKAFDSKQGTLYFLKRDKGNGGDVGKEPKKDTEDIKKGGTEKKVDNDDKTKEKIDDEKEKDPKLDKDLDFKKPDKKDAKGVMFWQRPTDATIVKIPAFLRARSRD